MTGYPDTRAARFFETVINKRKLVIFLRKL